MRTRPTTWYDSAETATVYGIEVLHNGEWLHVAENNIPLLFSSEGEREQKRMSMKREEAEELKRLTKEREEAQIRERRAKNRGS